MITILTSSPCIEGSPDINPENRFILTLKRVIKPDARVLFISAAPDDADFCDWCGQSMCRSLESAGLRFSSLSFLDARTASEAQTLIDHSDFIILGGGHVPTQNAFLQKIHLRERLKNYWGVVMGISAGSMNSADIVYAQPEEPGEGVDPNYKHFLPGLNLAKTQILPHYQKVGQYTLDGKRLYEDLTFADSFGHSFYVFVDGTYLVAENGSETIYGVCWRIADGVMTKICELGETIKII